MGQKVLGLPDVSSSLPALHTLHWSLLHVLISAVSSTHLSAARLGVILLLPAPLLHLFLLCLSSPSSPPPPSLGSSSQSNSQEANRNTHTHTHTHTHTQSRKRLISEIRRGWEQPWKSHIFSSHGICRLQVFLLSDAYRKVECKNVFHSFKYHNSAVNVKLKTSAGSRVSESPGQIRKSWVTVDFANMSERQIPVWWVASLYIFTVLFFPFPS